MRRARGRKASMDFMAGSVLLERGANAGSDFTDFSGWEGGVRVALVAFGFWGGVRSGRVARG
jgi:hypothetical protein